MASELMKETQLANPFRGVKSFKMVRSINRVERPVERVLPSRISRTAGV